jgi:hypothetical protein
MNRLTIEKRTQVISALVEGNSLGSVVRMTGVALHYMWYNFARVHKTLRVTPAVEAGIADHVWTIEEIVRLSN